MPIQTFNPFPRPISDSGGSQLGWPDGYLGLSTVSITNTTNIFSTTLQISGNAGVINSIMLVTPTNGSTARITWDTTNISNDMQNTTSVGGGILISPRNLGQNAQLGGSGPLNLFFTDNVKIEFKSNSNSQSTGIYICYSLAKAGAKKYRTISTTGNPAVGNNLINVRGNGFLHFLFESGVDSYTVAIDGVNRTVTSSQGGPQPLLAAGSGVNNGPDGETTPFSKSLQLTRLVGSTITTVVYTIGVD